MTGYEQAMRHARNHRKDRFYQQCSCYFGDGEPDGFEVPKDIFSDLSAKSMEKIHLFGQEIGSTKELAQFASDYA